MLASFKGREDRASFWPYAALAFGIVMVAGSLMILPMIAHLMQAAPEIAAADPGDVTFSPEPENPAPVHSGALAPSLPVGYLTAYLGVTFGLAVLLYAAAVVRRLHDRGRSGAWGLMPLPFFACTSVAAIALFGSMSRGDRPDMILLFTLAASNVFGWATLLALVAILAGSSDAQPNRYG